MEKFQPKFEAPKDQGSSQGELGDIKRRTIEALDNVTDEEVKQVLEGNSTIRELGVRSFACMAWNLIRKRELEQHPEITGALRKYPLVDLGSGSFWYSRDLLEELAWKGIKIPKYIGVDKHNISPNGEAEEGETNELRDMLKKQGLEGTEVELKNTDMLLFLRSLKSESVNIQIAGFDYDVSRPQSGEDTYRALLIKEIARAVAKDGVVISIANDGLSGQYKGVDVSLLDFGFEQTCLNEDPMTPLEVYMCSSREQNELISQDSQ